MLKCPIIELLTLTQAQDK
uniref:Uncharacterized protein n=1 Tax=Arundo donax TaxID=35708 RepID=A0A0A9BNS9_ARUDO